VIPCDGRVICKDPALPPPTALEKALRVIAVLTMLMTVPQVVAVWSRTAEGVSLTSWIAYLGASVAWLAYGVQKRDATICLTYAGWIFLDLAIVAGIVVGR
jgi:uncharacterized protein with PQ loop repeat